MTKLTLLLAALQGYTEAFQYDVKEGHCPYKPGEIKSHAVHLNDLGFLEGPWINVFDRKELNENIKCYSVDFMNYFDT